MPRFRLALTLALAAASCLPIAAQAQADKATPKARLADAARSTQQPSMLQLAAFHRRQEFAFGGGVADDMSEF